MTRTIPVDFEWQGVEIRNSGIRVRGNATRSGHKPSFRIDFNRYVDGQDLGGLKAIVLNNMWHDPSMLHDRLSMLTFRRVGIPAPRQAHVRLFVGAGREYAGVYAISEEVEQDVPRRRTSAETMEYLYEFHHQPDEIYGFEDPGPDLGWYIPRFGAKTHETESVANLYMPDSKSRRGGERRAAGRSRAHARRLSRHQHLHHRAGRPEFLRPDRRAALAASG